MAGVPNNIVIPFVGVSFDSARAVSGPSTMPVKLAVIGQKLAAGTGTANTLYLVSSADEVAVLGGFGSMIHRQAIKSFKNNKVTSTYIIMLDDAGTATPATQVITVSGTATAVGEVAIYIAGERIAVGVEVGDDLDAFGANAVIAINAITDLQVTAAYAGGDITLTCRNGGIAAGDLDVRLNAGSGEATPAGLVVAVGTYAAGTVDPDVQDALDAIGDTWINVGTQPYTDDTSMTAVEEHATAEADVLVQRDGEWYQAKRATRAEMITFGEDGNRNNQFMSTLPAYKRMESTYEIAAAVAAVTALSIEDDPAVPLHRIPLVGLTALASGDAWTFVERNQLALAGIATFTDDLSVQTEATVTMYLKNSAGASDIAYQQQNTVFQLMRLRYRFVNRIVTRYPNAKLSSDVREITDSTQQVMTPQVAQAEAIAWFKAEQRDKQVENLEQFKRDLVVQRDPTNPNRMNWLLPPDLINQFIVGSGVMQFRLQGS